MPRTYTCDNCNMTVGANSAARWFELQRIGINTTALGEAPGPWLFCSVACLWSWSADHKTRNLAP